MRASLPNIVAIILNPRCFDNYHTGKMLLSIQLKKAATHPGSCRIIRFVIAQGRLFLHFLCHVLILYLGDFPVFDVINILRLGAGDFDHFPPLLIVF